MTKPTRVAAFCLAGVFAAGGLFGVVAHAVYSQRETKAAAAPSPKDLRSRYLDRLSTRLSLTPEQRGQVTAILDESGERFRNLRERMDPEFEAIRQIQRQKIIALLGPEQRAEYQKVIEEQRRRREEQRARGR